MIKRFFTVAVLLVSIGCIACAQTKINLASQVKGILPTANGGLGNSTGNAPTASSLLSTPTTCGAGLAARGILANGNATGCFSVPGSGTVTSVGLSMPSWLSVANTPVTSAGTLTVTAAGSQTSHQVIGTCGTATSFAPCSLVAGDIPSLPVGNILPGTNGQCVITLSSATVWGSCSGTVGVQTVESSSGNFLSTVNGNTTAVQSLGTTYTFAAGALNAVGKSFSVTVGARGTNGSGSTETVDVNQSIGSTNLNPIGYPVTTGGLLEWSYTMVCTVFATGSSGSMLCSFPSATTQNSGGSSAGLNGSVDFVVTANLTASLAISPAVAFTVASSSNVGGLFNFVVQQLN
ncbi:MAG TPA: hypothetical protein VGS15_06920 [Candidatus Acidoferrales bacterium]|nr:hypothetical protein [Candidatus Acidoferrales bacterium]